MNEQKISEGEKAISLGKMLYGGSQTSLDFKIPMSLLSRHTLLSGINGTGKTNTIQSMLNGIGTLPFLVIEPAKTEYVDWAIEYNKSHKNSPIDIYIPGAINIRANALPSSFISILSKLFG